MSHGPVAFCHAARKGGYTGSYWPKRRRAPFLLGTNQPMKGHLLASLAGIFLISHPANQPSPLIPQGSIP